MVTCCRLAALVGFIRVCAHYPPAVPGSNEQPLQLLLNASPWAVRPSRNPCMATPPFHLCSLINALERGGQWQLAEKLFLSMCTVQVCSNGQGVRRGSRGDFSRSMLQIAMATVVKPNKAWPHTLPACRTRCRTPPPLRACWLPRPTAPAAASCCARRPPPPQCWMCCSRRPAAAGACRWCVEHGQVEDCLAVVRRVAACQRCTCLVACLTHQCPQSLVGFLCLAFHPTSQPRHLHTTQMSIAESPRADGGWDGLSASLGILSATANARQDVLGGLPAGPLAAAPAGPATPQQQPQQLTAGEMEQLSSRFGGFALDGSAPGTTGAGGPDPASDPFAAASHLVSSVRGSSTASE